jgi:pimeloyl-ACP methyl ester carboxylesterase
MSRSTCHRRRCGRRRHAGNRSHRVPLARALRERGYGVLLVDDRGYGGNPASPTESGLAADARAAHAYLETRKDFESARLVYFGESLGAAVALRLAMDHPPGALVLRSPFTSLADIAAIHYPFLPASVLLRDEYPSRARLEGFDVPMLVIAGSADRIVPPDQSRELFEAASGQKQMVVIEGAGHNDLALLAGDEMIEAIVDFLDEHLPG